MSAARPDLSLSLSASGENHDAPRSCIQPRSDISAVKHLLVADRSPDINRLLQIILENERIKVHTASCADKALQIASAHKINVFIIGASLAGPQGALSLHNFFRETKPFREIPILLVIGAPGSISASTLQRKGVAGSIAKPFTIKDVKKAVFRILMDLDIEK